MFGQKPTVTSNGADDLAAAIAEFHAKAAAAISKIREESAQAHLTDAERVEKANRFIKETGVGVALVSVWESTRHFPAWSKRDDFFKWNAIGATNISGDRTKEGQKSTETVAFNWKGQEWTIAFIDGGGTSYDGEDRYAVLRLQIGGEMVYAADISKSLSAEYANWGPSGIKALSIGPWVGDLIEARHVFEASSQRRHHEAEAARLSEQASKIKF